MRNLTIILFLSFLCLAQGQIPITPENLSEAQLVDGSLSSDGIGLFCVNHGSTTVTSMILMNAEQKQKILAQIPIHSTYATPKRYKNWLTIKWNKQGNLVAIHDSLNKHSKVHIYHLQKDGAFKKVALPDMVVLEAGGRLGIDTSTIVTSGQEPDVWKTDNALMVKYRFKTKSGTLYRRTLPIRIDESGKFQPQ